MRNKKIRGYSSVGRAGDSKSPCREFDPLYPLQYKKGGLLNDIKISDEQITKFIKDEGLDKLKDRVQIIRIVSKYFGTKVDGNDVNRILREVFGR